MKGNYYLGFTSQNYDMIMSDAVVEGWENSDHLVFFNVRSHRTAQVRVLTISPPPKYDRSSWDQTAIFKSAAECLNRYTTAAEDTLNVVV